MHQDGSGSGSSPPVGDPVRDPYPRLARKRRERPVEWTRSYTGFDAVALYRFEDVASALRDDQVWSAGAAQEIYGPVMGEHVMVGMDGPEHRRHRGLVSPAFRQKVLERWADDQVRPVLERLVDTLSAGGDRVDLVPRFTATFPVWVIASILGLPSDDWLRFRAWSMAIIDPGGAPERARTASRELASYLRPLIDQRRATPMDDLLSELAGVRIEGEHLSDEEILSFLRLLLPAGVETTYRSSGSVLFGLLCDPEQLDAVRADPSLLPAAIEEGLRWEPPVLITTRVARQDTRLGSLDVAAGSWLVAHLGSANRDESRWDDPERFDVFRAARPSLSFGHGPHVCLGMHLARLETRIALAILLDRYPYLRLDARDEDPHISGRLFRSPTCLPVQLR